MRLSLDMLADENGQTRRLYYNCRSAALDDKIARTALELAHWALAEAGFSIPIKQLEYVDFFTGNTMRVARRRPSTVRQLKTNAKLIETIWPTL